CYYFFCQAEDGIRDRNVTGVQTCALPISKPRAIELLNENTNYVEKDNARYVPVIGKVTAGIPITAIENIEEYTPIPSSSSNSNNQLFVLVVEGDSMVNAGILDNDRVVVKQQNTAENGDI